mmetsp:Transcript_22548/g.25369  ORF Transcript_22548/g.25369 Transcript_22548/m.25369 type:complete len:434 (-) Transcript_22548:137-1438(-)|eukprot:CAMPEP_0114988736 /NCGR_PEP_ID=MMETSP0216-20121206/9777_1 /TAXON_ID=223996 /ORGANISM="Protocruzia adherens, Strain Boccale" /LENGTH=433 /DNA_ID=CAMNT_0002351575 /DNA_START=903 /DNA_END=2204 /DNA_ORIENTATION=-
MDDPKELPGEGEGTAHLESEYANEDMEQHVSDRQEDPRAEELKYNYEFDGGIMPYHREVEILLPDGQVKTVQVEIEVSGKPKPYLGGYQNMKTGLEYHHAYAQTDQRQGDHAEKFHREVQTHEYRTRATTMKREFGTQMAKIGVWVDERTDKMIEARPYFDSQQWEDLRIKTALFIQCHIRGWFARRRAKSLKQARDDRERMIKDKEQEFRRQEEVKHREEIERRMHPKTFKDFEILYSELESWRLTETQKIKESTELSEDEKKYALKQLLHKEVKLLQTIDRLKISANVQNRDEKIKSFLHKMSDAKGWQRTDGRLTEVHTPFTTRAKELMDLYNGLKLPFLSIDERLDVLLHTKWTVKEFDCNLTREIVDLIDREADMLNRGRSETSLEGLRKRLVNLFLQFIETPEFNPEAARLQRIPRELLQTTNTVYE